MIFPKVHSVKKNSYKQTVNGFIPKTVFIPLDQDSEKDGKCLVEIGQPVEEGQLLSSRKNASDEFSHNVYSSVPGILEDIVLCKTPSGKTVESAKIKLKGSFKYLGKKQKNIDVKKLSPNAIIRDIAEKGVLNTFVTESPTYLAEDVADVSRHKNRILIVRLFDDDPYRMIDGILSNLYQDKINEGIRILIKALDADGIVVVTDNNFEKPDIFNPFDIPAFFLKFNVRAYSATYKKSICKEIKKRTKQAPFSKINKYDLFVDSTTILEMYDCLRRDAPVLSRLVHVSGDCIPASGILNVPVGTTFKELAEQCGGFLRNPGAIIVNGMITGYAAASLDVPVTKYVKSVSFIPKTQCPDQRQTVCIRCGNCRSVCPNRLSPDIIYRHIAGGMPAAADYKASAMLCFNCGLCNAVCPSRLPLSQRIHEFALKRTQKEEISKEQGNEYEKQ